MVNSISNQMPRLRPAAETDATLRPASLSGQSSTAPVASADSLRLSTGASSLPEALRQGPPIDSAMVERISEAIAAGRYPIDPAKIADALFRDYLDFQA